MNGMCGKMKSAQNHQADHSLIQQLGAHAILLSRPRYLRGGSLLPLVGDVLTVTHADGCQRHLEMSFFAEKECHFSPGSIQVYTALITVPLVGLKPVKS